MYRHVRIQDQEVLLHRLGLLEPLFQDPRLVVNEVPAHDLQLLQQGPYFSPQSTPTWISLIHHLILLLQCHADQAIGLATFNFSGNAPLHGDKCVLIIANTLHPRGDPGWHDPEHLSVYEISAKIAADEACDFARLPRSARKHPQSSLSREFASVTGKDNVIRAGCKT